MGGNIMVISINRSAAGAYFQSPGNVVDPGRYWYDPSDTNDTEVNLTDFISWSNTRFTSGMYSDVADSSDYELYNLNTGVYIGKVTNRIQCTPKIGILDTLVVTSLAYPTLAPAMCPEIADASYQSGSGKDIWVAMNYMQTSHIPKKYRYSLGRYLRVVSPTSTVSITGLAFSSLSMLPDYFFYYPGSTTKVISLDGRIFRDHKIKVTIDTDIDLWYQGKFLDGSDVIGTYSGICYRNALSMRGSYSYYPGGLPPFTQTHYSCLMQNTQVTLV